MCGGRISASFLQFFFSISQQLLCRLDESSGSFAQFSQGLREGGFISKPMNDKALARQENESNKIDSFIWSPCHGRRASQFKHLTKLIARNKEAKGERAEERDGIGIFISSHLISHSYRAIPCLFPNTFKQNRSKATLRGLIINSPGPPWKRRQLATQRERDTRPVWGVQKDYLMYFARHRE